MLCEMHISYVHLQMLLLLCAIFQINTVQVGLHKHLVFVGCLRHVGCDVTRGVAAGDQHNMVTCVVHRLFCRIVDKTLTSLYATPWVIISSVAQPSPEILQGVTRLPDKRTIILLFTFCVKGSHQAYLVPEPKTRVNFSGYLRTRRHHVHIPGRCSARTSPSRC